VVEFSKEELSGSRLLYSKISSGQIVSYLTFTNFQTDHQK
jgi:hypothetical protein